MATVRCAGAPLGESLSLSSVASPLLLAWVPLELIVPSKFATPDIPELGSINPEAAKSKPLTLIFASKGVIDASFELIGPAVPSSFAFPPPGRSAVKVKGNCELYEKFFTVKSTFLYTCALAGALVSATEICPPLMLSFPTDKFCSIEDSDFGFAASFGFCVALPPGVAGEVFFASVPDGGAACPALDGGGAPVFFVGLAAPRVEKFHLP